MDKNQLQVRAFMMKYAQSLEPTFSTRMFRMRLISEEAAELLIALHENDRKKLIDATADLLYVIYGTAEVYNFSADIAFERVHESNMTKDAESKHGKPVKGTNFKEPYLDDLIIDSFSRGYEP